MNRDIGVAHASPAQNRDGIPAQAVEAVRIRADGAREATSREVPEEVPIALVFNGVSHAVMLATPADLEDFALGFALSEGILSHVGEVRGVEIVRQDGGLEARLTIATRPFEKLKARRRSMVGPSGCGLCGVDSLAAASRTVPRATSGARMAAETLRRALLALPTSQTLNQATGAVHAAAWLDGDGALRGLREDVGRHNALDKLIGALASAGVDCASGALLLTSRCSIELVYKAAAVGMPIMTAVSAPTAHAVRTATAANITLVALARTDAMLVFSHPDRIV